MRISTMVKNETTTTTDHKKEPNRNSGAQEFDNYTEKNSIESFNIRLDQAEESVNLKTSHLKLFTHTHKKNKTKKEKITEKSEESLKDL